VYLIERLFPHQPSEHTETPLRYKKNWSRLEAVKLFKGGALSGQPPSGHSDEPGEFDFTNFGSLGRGGPQLKPSDHHADVVLIGGVCRDAKLSTLSLQVLREGVVRSEDLTLGVTLGLDR